MKLRCSCSNKRVITWKLGVFTVFCCASVLQCTGFAQQLLSPGLVTGRILCADSGAPARFVHVVLSPLPNTPESPTQTRQESTTDRDGRILFSNVSVGTYFIDVSLPGYLQPLHLVSPEALQNSDPQIRKVVLNRIPHVTLENGSSATIAISIERGAALSGRVTYDDGAPIENITVIAKRIKHLSTGQNNGQGSIDTPTFQSGIATDDRGRYRITGLPAGTYIVSAKIVANHLKTDIGPGNILTLSTTQPGDVNLVFYAPSSTQESKAQKITLVQGDEKQGIDFTADLTALRSISGIIHRRGIPIKGAGLELKDQNDPENRHGTVADEKGFFRFDLLPQGNYNLMVYSPVDNSLPEDPQDRKPSLSMPIAVQNGDVSDLSIDLANSSQ
ncbi:carboxypeptidase-like regulatory domain-containing protein [Tunturibacter empetritectus]|uniref:Carboxypeptidase-like regulatory domain-containing protein n=1 Tax=Tunturiibacter empetritectus TaxID=3069691 RepID=A0AAU7ZFK9_9BACT